MLIFSLIPFAALFLLFLICYAINPALNIYVRIRQALLLAVLISALYCAAITEALSLIKQINFTGILLAWAIPLLALAYYAYKRKVLAYAREIGKSLISLLTVSWIIPLILLILAVSFTLAVIYPTNNWDSLTYHMARVAHWVQNGTVANYQTHVLRQLISPPLAEWIILQLQVLTKSDTLANAVQLFFFAGGISNITLITQELGGSRRQQLLSALFTSLIPMAIIQSNTTQNDIVAGFFISAFVYFTIRLLKNFSLRLIVLCGIALGLGCLTKGTTYIFSILFCGWFALLLLKDYRLPFKLILKKGFLIALIPFIAVTINYSFLHRNMTLNGSPMGNLNKYTANEGMEIKPLTMVFLKNILNHMPATSVHREQITNLASSWGIDVNDSRYSYNSLAFMATGFSYHEDFAQNYVHTILIIAFGVFFLLKRSLYRQPVNYYTLFTFTIYATAILFCVLLKWQPWSNRLETPLFMLFCVTLAMEIGRWPRLLQPLFFLPMLYFGYYSTFTSRNHPVLPLEENIFKQSYDAFIFKPGILECAKYLDNTDIKKIGIVIGSDTWDYPFYKRMAKGKNGPRILEHVLVMNESSSYAQNFIPEAILSYDQGLKYDLAGETYYREKIFTGGLAIYLPQ